MKVTHFNTKGLPLALGGWSTGVTSINSNATTTDGGLSAINFVQRITANGSNVLLNPSVNFAAGSNIALSASSNTITITNTGSGGGTADVPWSYAQADGGLVGDGTTDDTAAFQAWITSVTASGTQSGWFWFEAGTYLIGGALQDTGAFNGQVLLPSVSTSSKGITLYFKGQTRAPFALPGPIPTGTGYAIIKSTLTGASGTAAVISGGNGTFPTKNNVSVVVEDLLCLAPDNPTFTFWNVSTCQGGAFRDVYINCTSTYSGTPVQPTHSNAYGVKLPQWSQSNYTYVDGICVGGFYTGYLQGELAVLKGAIAAFCIVGLEFPLTYHASQVISLQITGCVYGMRATDTHYAEVYLYDIERITSPSWATTVYDLDDASNFLYGNIRWYSLVGATLTRDHTFLVNGGSNTSNSEVGAIAGSGVTSVALTMPAGFTVTGSPITTSGTLAVTGSSSSTVIMASGGGPPDPVLTSDGLDWTYSS